MWKKDIVEIKSRDYWVKIVEMLQQNWALIDSEGDESVRVFFFHDLSGVFDEMTFQTREEACMQLRWNGFERLIDNKELREFFRYPPEPPFWRAEHPNGRIYSSGRFWRDYHKEL